MASNKSKLRKNFILENTGKHKCACGCDGYIKILKHHNSMGIPKFIHGHNISTEEARKASSERMSIKIGSLHHNYIKDRNMVKGPRRWIYNFTKRQKRDIYLKDKGICQECSIICRTDVDRNHPEAVNIDHIIPIEDGGMNEIFNGQVLCVKCHKIKNINAYKAKRMNSGKPRTGNPEPSRV